MPGQGEDPKDPYKKVVDIPVKFKDAKCMKKVVSLFWKVIKLKADHLCGERCVLNGENWWKEGSVDLLFNFRNINSARSIFQYCYYASATDGQSAQENTLPESPRIQLGWENGEGQQNLGLPWVLTVDMRQFSYKSSTFITVYQQKIFMFFP